ncbi:MAG: FAD-binding oxidoreductase [Hyphomonadaceae bacterium]|nr:FAD-binding oxidoreductase [Hyphomonadaceae bacterium]
MQTRNLTVVGAGITGLWQALTLARKGHRVRLLDRSQEPFGTAASAYAGAMLGPFCETEVYAPVIRDLGLTSIGLWRQTFPGTVVAGTLVIASARDRSEVDHFARLTEGYERIGGDAIARLEPDLAGRFSTGLFYAQEAHVAPLAAMQFLLEEIKRAGVNVAFGTEWRDGAAKDEMVIDCRGLGARAELADLRGVRGERLIVRTREIGLHRPVRVLHPRHSIYVVPWGDGRHMIGATVIESDDMSPITVRSALELLGMAYALHPAFGEAQIVDAGAGVRPAFADNVPKVAVRGQTIHVNGLYRHGFLLAPALAELVAAYLETGAIDNRVFVVEPS